jgi:hypothetical protein
MGKYLIKINLVVFNILIWHFYQIHKLIDGIAIDVCSHLKSFHEHHTKSVGGNARGLGHSQNNGPLRPEAKGPIILAMPRPKAVAQH